MRDTFFRTLAELAERDSRIVLLTGDIGYMAIEPFSERFPERFFNVGVAEQNMVGLATGLAEGGFIPFVYSIVSFVVLRPYEFIRNGPILHQLPVRIVSAGGGLEYGSNGPSHYGLEDLGILGIQPGLTLIIPADFQQARKALTSTYDYPGPLYIRLSKDNSGLVPGLDARFELGKAQLIGSGTDLLLVSTGRITTQAVEAQKALAEKGIHCTVLVIDNLKYVPPSNLPALLATFRRAVTVEVHYSKGGIGSLVSEVVAQGGLNCRVTCCGIHDLLDGSTGSAAYLHQKYGLTTEAILQTCLQALDQ